MLPDKRLIPFESVSCVVAAISVLVSYPSLTNAAIQGSVHDLSDTNPNGEYCKVCHTPHPDDNSIGTLWNHETSTAEYTLYNSDSMYIQPDPLGVGSISRLCLSCHDGTIAIDSYAGQPGTPDNNLTGIFSKGTDLRDDHPVSLRWVHQTQGDGGVAVQTCTNCHGNDGNTPRAQIGGGLKFFNTRIECATCHDVHNEQVQDIKLLRKPLAGSELCLTCHPK